ncbi:MAG TPA: hypothetical protein VGX37_13570 [Allosphingosinicella sp.]|jgi:hypothetical protein|nr:hypothetical protein [Allosphingosinicella sp.]
MSEPSIERAIAVAEAWQTNPDPEFFEERVLPTLLPILARAQNSEDPRLLADWLETFSTVAGVSDEELATRTSELLAKDPQATIEARGLLSASARARLALFVEEWERGPEDEGGTAHQIQSEMLRRNLRAVTAEDVRPVLVKFVGESTFMSSRGFPVVKGKMTVNNRDGTTAAVFETNTGGGASTYRRTNGPVPPGAYVVSNFLVRDKFGMVRDGVGYSLNLDPAPGTPVFGRSLFRIHPDGASPGTNGCLGVAEGGPRLVASRDLLRQLVTDGQFLASVQYAGMG